MSIFSKKKSKDVSPTNRGKWILFFSFWAFAIGLIILSFLKPPFVWRIFLIRPTITDNVTFEGMSVKILLFFIAHYVLVLLFGYALCYRFFKNVSNVSLLFKLFASFYIGFICMMGVVRPLTPFFHYGHIYWPVITLALVTIIFQLFLNKADWPPLKSIPSMITPKSVMTFFAQTAFLSVLIGTVLMLQMSQAEFKWVGHGPDQYAYLLEEWRVRQYFHFPIVSQHHAELLFHYFFTIMLLPTFEPIVPWWITLAIIKASMWAFLYLAFKRFGVSSILSFIFCLFIFVGTTSLVPTKYYLLFDTSNPFYFTVHGGRIIGIGIVLLLLMDIFHNSQNRTFFPILFFIFGGMGLTVTSFSNVLWILPLYFLGIIYSVYYKEALGASGRIEYEKS